MERVALERHGLEDGRGTVMGVKQDQISWARLYMKPVEEAGQNIDEAMRTITGRKQAED